MQRPSFFGFALLCAVTAHAADCNRACLKETMTKYLDALVAQDASKAPLAANVRFTEDSKDLKPGEGFWKLATKLGSYRQDFIDVKDQIVLSHVIVEESGKPAFFTGRLKVAKGKITEAETLVTHPGERMAPRPEFTTRPGMELPPPAGKRNKREDLIRIADYYPRGLTIGGFDKVDAPFSSNAFRIENGIVMAGEGCGRGTPSGRPTTPAPGGQAAATATAPQDVAVCRNIKTQRIIEHPDLTKSLAAVDEEQGIVVFWMNFGDTGTYGPGNALVTFEAFKVFDNKLKMVQAFLKVMPKETQRGWGTTRKGAEKY